MAEASFNKSLTYPNGNEMTKSEIEVAEQLIQLRMISKRKDMMTLEEELQCTRFQSSKFSCPPAIEKLSNGLFKEEPIAKAIEEKK
ncbi:hypothetical protein P8452_28220 [Trifolium repens]|nr:hypothetical protein P8452_28220 [Trifolium repens]